MSDYRIEFGRYDDPAALESLLDMLKASFEKTDKFTVAYKTWQYLDNPNGKVVSFNAFAPDGSIAAHYAAIPVRMMLGGRPELGLLSLDTATRPEHRGKGLFTRLATATYDFARENGYRFVIGVANANSTHGFLKKLGFYLVAPLDFKVGVGDIYKSAVPETANRLLYDVQTLKWRLSCPAFSYSLNGNTICGSRKEPLFHTAVGKAPECISCLDCSVLKKSLDVFNIYVGLGADTSNGIYVNLPGFIKRSPFNLIFKDLTDGNLPLLTKDNVFFQLMDYDVA